MLARAFLTAITLSSSFAAAEPRDKGVFSDLDEKVPLEVPAPSADDRPARLQIDDGRGLATVYYGSDPVGLYRWPLAPEARAKLPAAIEERHGAPPASEDRDGDGIVDRLDIVRGAKKLTVNKAAYHEAYRGMRYPGGDVPRSEGVCTDTIVRALRNAGIDLQREVHDDIVAGRRAYPMVEKLDPNINHRRVKTILVWFKRHAKVLAAGEDYQPGDVVFFDTFPQKPGAEHVGIVSDTRGRDGKYLVVNNWTDGYVDSEMPLLSSIAVTDHFRIAPTTAAATSGHARSR
jgi:uncharacterized protein YijF (DUF1287 family)